MKKILFALIALVCSMSINAQVMKIYKGEVLVATYTADQADRVVYEEAPAVVNVTAITLNKATAELTIGGEAALATTTLIATVAPENATDKTVTWSSDNVEIATVSAEGVVTAVKAGTATIKATANDGSEVVGSCTVTVKQLVTSVTLDKTTAEIGIDKTVTLTATVNPTDASDKTIEWTTNDKTIATVDQTGKVTGVAAGEVTITATAKDGSGKSATCTITVSDLGGQSDSFSLGNEGDLGYDEVDW